MRIIFACKDLSFKNTIWLVILMFSLVFVLYLTVCTLDALRDSMKTIITVLETRRDLKNDKKVILLLSHKMLYNRLTYCPSAPNCLLTENKGLYGGDLTLFDAIIFDEGQLEKNWSHRRSMTQLYIFTSIESPAYYPACEIQNDDFFNWTFTYRLDSDINWRYFVVRNQSRDVVAPSKHVEWVENTQNISVKLKSIFKGRTKAAAWLVTNCYSLLRNEYLYRLKEYLYQFTLQIDIFGGCTKRKCNGNCNKILRENYFFYMAFENSLSEDYVTEKVLHGYDNYVVPIVYGGANYTRFLPPGSYIDARNLHPYNLAQLINLAMTHPEVYDTYFHWTNLYTIDSDYSTFHPTCQLCNAINSDRAKNAPAKKKFRIWWNTLSGMKWCLPDEHLYYNDLMPSL